MATRKIRNLLRRSRSNISKSNRNTRKHLGGALTTPPKIIFGRIHAVWCGHCINLNKLWSSILREIKQHTKKEEVKFISIKQNEESKKLPWENKHFIKSGAPVSVQGGYPTLFKIVDGQVHYYNGPREPKSIAEFVIGK